MTQKGPRKGRGRKKKSPILKASHLCPGYPITFIPTTGHVGVWVQARSKITILRTEAVTVHLLLEEGNYRRVKVFTIIIKFCFKLLCPGQWSKPSFRQALPGFYWCYLEGKLSVQGRMVALTSQAELLGSVPGQRSLPRSPEAQPTTRSRQSHFLIWMSPHHLHSFHLCSVAYHLLLHLC